MSEGIQEREKNSKAWFQLTAEELSSPGLLLRPAIPSGVRNTVCWHLTLRVSYGFPRGMPCFPRKVARLHRAACHGQGCCLPLCGGAS